MIALFVAAQAEQTGVTPAGHGLLPVALSMVVAVALVSAPLPGAARRPPRLLAGVPLRLGIAVVASIAILAIAPDGPAIAVLAVAAWAAPARHPLPRALTVELLILAGLLLLGLTGRDWDTEISAAVGSCVAFLASYAVQQRKATRKAEEREAVLAERARIARELHDILAHSLSAQIVHLEGARLLLRSGRADEALTRVDRARDLAKGGLEEARRAVSALREGSTPLPAALTALAEEFREATGLVCDLTVTGAERRLVPEVELAVVRTAQEALTNARRHAPGATVDLRLNVADDGCELVVTNPATNGTGDPGGGYGLVGMRERAALLNGTLAAGDVDGAFQVRLRLPVDGGARP